MKVKVFTAKTIQEAMAQVKYELGRDAVILNTRRLRKGGIMGLFAKDVVEVMAAIDTPILPVKPNNNVATPPEKVELSKNVNANAEYSGNNIAELHSEISDIRKTIELLSNSIPKNFAQPEKRNSEILDFLLKNEIDEKVAEGLLQGIPIDKFSFDSDRKFLNKLLHDKVSAYLRRIEGITVPENGCKTVAFIGPTGVGKTTTIAKLAANFVIKEGCKVALITADTYRIAAVEQLKTYADIIGIPIDIVYTPEDLKTALYRHQDKDLVLIDTAGRSPHNSQHIEELKLLLAIDPGMEIHLVLSTTTKYSDALDIIKKFSVCSPKKLLFTKVDEANKLGTLINLMYQFPTTLSYITTGQSVPEDIELINPDKLVNLILRDIL